MIQIDSASHVDLQSNAETDVFYLHTRPQTRFTDKLNDLI